MWIIDDLLYTGLVHVHAVQVELGRRLYMDEATYLPASPGWEKTRAYCRDLVSELGVLELVP